MNECPMCGSSEAKHLGDMGVFSYYRCRDCGADYSDFTEDDEMDEGFEADEVEESALDEDYDYEPDTYHDLFDDAEALASAGFGTDEDYGYFGGDE